jgi:hypothetical protein
MSLAIFVSMSLIKIVIDDVTMPSKGVCYQQKEFFSNFALSGVSLLCLNRKNTSMFEPIMPFLENIS